MEVHFDQQTVEFVVGHWWLIAIVLWYAISIKPVRKMISWRCENNDQKGQLILLRSVVWVLSPLLVPLWWMFREKGGK